MRAGPIRRGVAAGFALHPASVPERVPRDRALSRPRRRFRRSRASAGERFPDAKTALAAGPLTVPACKHCRIAALHALRALRAC
jgi:hypothetical protein